MLYLAKLTVRARERTFFGDELHDDAIQKMRARINSVLTHIRYLVYILRLLRNHLLRLRSGVLVM